MVAVERTQDQEQTIGTMSFLCGIYLLLTGVGTWPYGWWDPSVGEFLLSHPNIIQIFELGEAAGTYYIAVTGEEYVILELMDRILAHKHPDETMRQAYERVRAAKLLEDIPGLVLSLWALVSLGTSFGIAPALRGLVTTGPYHWLRHPMYAGELLSLLEAAIAVPSGMNLALLGIFAASILWRIEREERILNRNGYRAYATVVRWRLVPGVW